MLIGTLLIGTLVFPSTHWRPPVDRRPLHAGALLFSVTLSGKGALLTIAALLLIVTLTAIGDFLLMTASYLLASCLLTC